MGVNLGQFHSQKIMLMMHVLDLHFSVEEKQQLAALLREQNAIDSDISRLIPIYPIQREADESRGMYVEARCSICRIDYYEVAGPGERLTGLCGFHRPENARLAS